MTEAQHITLLFAVLLTLACGEIYRVPVEWTTLSFNTSLQQLSPGLMRGGIAGSDAEETDIVNLMASSKENQQKSKSTRISMKIQHEHLLGSINIGVPKDTKITQVGKKVSNLLSSNSYRVVFDTSSIQTWVLSQNAMRYTTSDDELKHKYIPLYGTKDLKRFTATYKAEYANGAVYTGEYALEDFNIGGVSSIGGFGIISVINRDGTNAGTDFDGYVGLALDEDPDIADNRKSPFHNMMRGKKFSEPKFSVYFSPDGRKGEFLFGGIDTKLFVPETLQRFDLSCDKGQWQVDLTIRFGETTPIFKDTHAIIDTSAKGIFVPEGWIDTLRDHLIFSTNSGLGNNDFKDIMRNPSSPIPRATLEINCDARDQLHPIEFVISRGHSDPNDPYSLDGEEYFPKVKWGKKHRCICVFEESIFAEENKINLGLPFLKKYYTVFDAGNMQMGFAVSKKTEKSMKKKAAAAEKKMRKSGGGSKEIWDES